MNFTIVSRGTSISHWTLYLLVLSSVALCLTVTSAKEKRQIFREQVVPALGGKVPEEAFRTDRLALNRLNKEGITVPDGVLLDARRVHRHPHPGTSMPDLLKVYLTSDEGHYHYARRKAIETTYVLQRPFTPRANQHRAEKSFESPHRTSSRAGAAAFTVYRPIVHPLLLPTRQPDPPNLWSVIGYPWAADYHAVEDHSHVDSRQILLDYLDYGVYLRGLPERFLRNVRSNDDSGNARWNGGDRTNLPGISKTNFTCEHIATNCQQVYHECFGWSKTGSSSARAEELSAKLKSLANDRRMPSSVGDSDPVF